MFHSDVCLESSCMVVVAELKDFSDATDHCATLGGHLMDINSDTENVIAKNAAQGRYMCILTTAFKTNTRIFIQAGTQRNITKFLNADRLYIIYVIYIAYYIILK